jgi:hypothetical protein
MPYPNTFHAAKAWGLWQIAAALVVRGFGENGRFAYSLKAYA